MDLRGQRVRLAGEIHEICQRIERNRPTLASDIAELTRKIDQFIACLNDEESGGTGRDRVNPHAELVQRKSQPESKEA